VFGDCELFDLLVIVAAALRYIVERLGPVVRQLASGARGMS
jgi:hypothetical protein